MVSLSSAVAKQTKLADFFIELGNEIVALDVTGNTHVTYSDLVIGHKRVCSITLLKTAIGMQHPRDIWDALTPNNDGFIELEVQRLNSEETSTVKGLLERAHEDQLFHIYGNTDEDPEVFPDFRTCYQEFRKAAKELAETHVVVQCPSCCLFQAWCPPVLRCTVCPRCHMAAVKIQTRWRRAISNPAYACCKKRLHSEMEAMQENLVAKKAKKGV